MASVDNDRLVNYNQGERIITALNAIRQVLDDGGSGGGSALSIDNVQTKKTLNINNGDIKIGINISWDNPSVFDTAIWKETELYCKYNSIPTSLSDTTLLYTSTAIGSDTYLYNAENSGTYYFILVAIMEDDTKSIYPIVSVSATADPMPLDMLDYNIDHDNNIVNIDGIKYYGYDEGEYKEYDPLLNLDYIYIPDTYEIGGETYQVKLIYDE